MEPNPLQQALDNYQLLERELQTTRAQNAELRAAHAGLVAENGVLREHMQQAENDRVRLQAVASTLLGRLLSINDVIGGAVKASIREGIEAATSHEHAEDREKAAASLVHGDAADTRDQAAPARNPSPAPSQASTGAMLAAVEFRR